MRDTEAINHILCVKRIMFKLSIPYNHYLVSSINVRGIEIRMGSKCCCKKKRIISKTLTKMSFQLYIIQDVYRLKIYVDQESVATNWET